MSRTWGKKSRCVGWSLKKLFRMQWKEESTTWTRMRYLSEQYRKVCTCNCAFFSILRKNLCCGTDSWFDNWYFILVSCTQLKNLEGAKDIPASSPDELKIMLQFYHDLGVLMYHPNATSALRDRVILDPQWLIDVFKSVITALDKDKRVRIRCRQLDKWVSLYYFSTGIEPYLSPSKVYRRLKYCLPRTARLYFRSDNFWNGKDAGYFYFLFLFFFCSINRYQATQTLAAKTNAV